MPIYEIPEMVGCGYPKSVRPANIQPDFRITGIHHFNKNVFTNDEFLPSENYQSSPRTAIRDGDK